MAQDISMHLCLCLAVLPMASWLYFFVMSIGYLAVAFQAAAVEHAVHLAAGTCLLGGQSDCDCCCHCRLCSLYDAWHCIHDWSWICSALCQVWVQAELALLVGLTRDETCLSSRFCPAV